MTIRLGMKPETDWTEEPRFIRHTHHHGFRTGQWAEILTIAPSPDGKDCYIVRFPDGVTDYWRVEDPSEPYEFSGGPPVSGAVRPEDADE